MFDFHMVADRCLERYSLSSSDTIAGRHQIPFLCVSRERSDWLERLTLIYCRRGEGQPQSLRLGLQRWPGEIVLARLWGRGRGCGLSSCPACSSSFTARVRPVQHLQWSGGLDQVKYPLRHQIWTISGQVGPWTRKWWICLGGENYILLFLSFYQHYSDYWVLTVDTISIVWSSEESCWL